jgi:phospholipase C/6-phosphogluconolactonase (cycloisomerase 2 family)
MYCSHFPSLGKLLFSVFFVFSALSSAVPQVAPATNSVTPRQNTSTASAANGLIQHVVIIMQENRSFDHYFATYPGAKGIPMDANGVPTVCGPDPLTNVCMRPYHSAGLVNYGGPHTMTDSAADIDNGKMDGFVAQAEAGKKKCGNTISPECAGGALDVMSYHTNREIPNYWTYAQHFVLQDNLYEPVGSYSLPAHLFMVSGWSAYCKDAADPMSCVSNIAGPPTNSAKQYGWTEITYLLYKNGISWKYYIESGLEPDCANGEMECAPGTQGSMIPGYWNPLPLFQDVQVDGQLGNIVPFDQFYIDARNGTLPAVSWIIPNNGNSDHPPNPIQTAQAYVTGLINAIMTGPNWSSTAIFLSLDDWGGLYDHLNPPIVDANGYGIRVPGLVISPYARWGFIDHQILSHDAYLKFIEDVFLNGQRLDPATDGRADSRPDVRENASILGDLMNDFNFNQNPRPPLLLYQYFNYSSFVYAANGATNDISAYAIDSRTGRLSAIAGSPFATGGLNPSAMAHDPQARFLFVANNGSNSISAYAINQATGALSPIQNSPFTSGESPVALAVDTTGGYLFCANAGSDELWTYLIHPSTGVLTKLSTRSWSPADSATQLAMDNSGRFLYLANSGTQQIFGYIFNSSNGNLSPMAGSPFSTGASGGPFGVAIDPLSQWAFSADGAANTVSQFAVGYTAGEAGALTPANPSSIPAGEDPTVISVSNFTSLPSGTSYLFALNRTSNNLSAYSVTGSGTLSALANSPFAVGTNPAGIGADAWDGYVYVASAAGISAFQVKSTTLLPVSGSPFPDPNNPQALDVIATAPVARFATSSTTTVSSSVNPSAYGQAVTFTAAVSSDTGALPRDGEMVTFNRGSTLLGTAALYKGLASFTTTALTLLTNGVRAVYAGDPNLPGSTSQTLSQVVNKAPTTSALTASVNPSVFGQAVTFTVTIAAEFGGTPTGQVTFKDGATILGNVWGGPKASLTTTKLAVGPHSITATYNGNSYYLSSTSGVITLTVDSGG